MLRDVLEGHVNVCSESKAVKNVTNKKSVHVTDKNIRTEMLYALVLLSHLNAVKLDFIIFPFFYNKIQNPIYLGVLWGDLKLLIANVTVFLK
jgi:hypothetical protein